MEGDKVKIINNTSKSSIELVKMTTFDALTIRIGHPSRDCRTTHSGAGIDGENSLYFEVEKYFLGIGGGKWEEVGSFSIQAEKPSEMKYLFEVFDFNYRNKDEELILLLPNNFIKNGNWESVDKTK